MKLYIGCDDFHIVGHELTEGIGAQVVELVKYVRSGRVDLCDAARQSRSVAIRDHVRSLFPVARQKV